MSFYLLRPCRGKAAFEAVPRERIQLDMERCRTDMEAHGYDVTDAGVMVVAVKGKLQVSIYPSGKLLIHTRSRENALEVANGLFEIFNIGEVI
jgi:TATA-box binding protein (TBP) (component of TFIID and TFIIIB)